MYWYRYEYYANGKLEEEDHCDRCQYEKTARNFLVEDFKAQHDELVDEFGKENIIVKPMSPLSDVMVIKNISTNEEYRYWIEPCA